MAAGMVKDRMQEPRPAEKAATTLAVVMSMQVKVAQGLPGNMLPPSGEMQKRLWLRPSSELLRQPRLKPRGERRRNSRRLLGERR